MSSVAGIRLCKKAKAGRCSFATEPASANSQLKMLSQRWSTFTLICAVAAAMTGGFFLGKDSRRVPMITAKQDADAAIQRSASLPENHSTINFTATDKTEDNCIKLFAEPATPQRDDDLVSAIEKL